MAPAVLQSIPEGFTLAVETINEIPQDILAEICRDVLLFLQYRLGTVSVGDFYTKLENVEIDFSKQSIQGAVNALIYLFRCAAREKVSADELIRELKGTLAWTENSLTVIKHLWSEQGKTLVSSDALQQMLNIGQLVDMKWKLGMAMSSDACRNLNSPYVSMTLNVADSSGRHTTKTFEMTIPEFQNFYKQMKEMASILETV
ncbi:COMM domain-containing protein 6-like [Saccoglossus kowalevskii]|uniref:COMM domain-containing protein 6 n=1 Tax=Saccoglossus kowalevskii TaxID=10224 RepID=A0ABM0GV76_SACKO|nr:PREDICTED: COMM domain-containing protein 6-like [Saccoglossus kowalevskii]